MNLKDVIHNLIKQNKEVSAFLETANNGHADYALVTYANFLTQSSYNAALSLYFANTLQFASDPEISEQFEPKDIEELYDSLLTLNEKCSDIYIDAANFADDTLNNKIKAKEIAEIGIKRLQIQIAELEELLKDVGS
jgi:hypothetical protein